MSNNNLFTVERSPVRSRSHSQASRRSSYSRSEEHGKIECLHFSTGRKCTRDGKPLGDTQGEVSVPAAVMAPKPGITGASWFAQCPPESDLAAVSYPVTLKSVLDPTFKFDTTVIFTN